MGEFEAIDPRLHGRESTYGNLYGVPDDLLVTLIDRCQAAEAEVERLREIISNPELGIKKLLVENGTIAGDFTAPPYVILLMAEAMAKMLDNAPNYTEAKIVATAGDRHQYVMRIERYFGKTPHELRREAEAELHEARVELEILRGEK